MAVTAASLIDPAGRILATMFPGDTSASLTERVDGWIAQAVADARIIAGGASDPMVTAFVYARAFGAVCDRLNAEAARVDFADQGSRTMLKEQLAYWASERDRALAELEALLEAEADDDVPVGAPLPSSYSLIGFTF